jgi:hypothetical protein
MKMAMIAIMNAIPDFVWMKDGEEDGDVVGVLGSFGVAGALKEMVEVGDRSDDAAGDEVRVVKLVAEDEVVEGG